MKDPKTMCKWCGRETNGMPECEMCWHLETAFERYPEVIEKFSKAHPKPPKSLDFFEYPKIQSPWKRDRKTGAFQAEWSTREICALRNATSWVWTEKLDGQNLRVLCQPPALPQVRGRTDRADLRPEIIQAAQEATQDVDVEALLFGEGIGPKIQKNGAALSGGEYRFVLFDVFVPEKGGHWLDFSEVRDFAQTYGIEAVVPVRGAGSLLDARDFVRDGFESYLFCAEPGTKAEGLVLRTNPTLFDKYGHRIITKIKTKDFRKGR